MDVATRRRQTAALAACLVAAAAAVLLHPAMLRAARGAEEAVPILMYHVIAPVPPGAPFPGLYVPPRR